MLLAIQYLVYCRLYMLGFQELRNKSISRLVKHSIVSVTAVSTAHHVDVDLLPKTYLVTECKLWCIIKGNF